MSAQSTASEFESDRQRHLRAFADQLPVEAERLTWPLERLYRFRDERLRALLRAAKARSPWHGKRLAGIDVDAVTGADLAAIPTMTKTDVMEHWDEIVTDRRLTLELAEAHLERVASEGPAYLLGEDQGVTTGGSSGRRGVFAWDFEGWLGFGLARERPTFWLRGAAGGDREGRGGVVAAARSTHPTAILPRPFAGSPQLGVGRSFPATLPLAEIVEGLNRFQPTDLFAYPIDDAPLGRRDEARTARHLAPRAELRRRAAPPGSTSGDRSGLRPACHEPPCGRRGRRDRALLPRV